MTRKHWSAAAAMAALIVFTLCGAGRAAEVTDAAKEARAEKAAEAKAAGKPAPAWPQWRGPRGDGFSPEVPKTMPAKKLLWSQEVAGDCPAGLAVGEGVVVIGDHEEMQRDIYRAFDAVKGTPLWTLEYPNTKEMEYGAAPKATPLIHKGKVYLLNAWGTLFCLTLKDGKEVWKKDLVEAFDAGEVPTWGYCSSPLLLDGLVVVNPGGVGASVVALKPETGEVAWKGKGGPPNYSNFIVATFGGVKQVVGYDAMNCNGWDAKTGERLWDLPVESSGGYIVPTPLAVGDRLLLASSDEDTRLHGFEQGGKIKQEALCWSDEMYPEMSSPVVWGDKLVLGASEGLVCLDPADKLKLLWYDDSVSGLLGLVHFITGGDRALAFGDDGTAVLLQPDRKACKILGKEKLTGNTYAHPALAGGRLYCRDAKKLYCYDFGAGAGGGEAEAPKPPTIKLPPMPD